MYTYVCHWVPCSLYWFGKMYVYQSGYKNKLWASFYGIENVNKDVSQYMNVNVII